MGEDGLALFFSFFCIVGGTVANVVNLCGILRRKVENVFENVFREFFFNLRLCMMKCNLFLLGSRNIYMDMFINFAVQNGDLELSIPYRSRNSLPIGRSWMYNICR